MCNCDSLRCVQNKYFIIVVQKVVLCCGDIQIENICGAEAITCGKVKQGRNVPEGENNALKRQRCAKRQYLSQNRIQVSQRRINAKQQLWGGRMHLHHAIPHSCTTMPKCILSALIHLPVYQVQPGVYFPSLGLVSYVKQ
ncbi:Hypothetical_protein [Hexamita inflata]|uniref:Hypothetical_protein n=1 Tax=Hexamita inflata TaxID=28002 RepID=A0AA86QPQ2_9EUKA|nr:Hypothetical protein HINF_LOCUS8202 [Hexamita inflata]CAI9961898.1 Hypothetical protein HINF_LOCUS49543 [Hexamita inflata]